MSEEVKNEEIETVDPDEITAEDLVEEKESFWTKTKNWCKSHKVAATCIGIATGSALIVGALYAGGKILEKFAPKDEEDDEDNDDDDSDFEDKTTEE